MHYGTSHSSTFSSLPLPKLDYPKRSSDFEGTTFIIDKWLCLCILQCYFQMQCVFDQSHSLPQLRVKSLVEHVLLLKCSQTMVIVAEIQNLMSPSKSDVFHDRITYFLELNCCICPPFAHSHCILHWFGRSMNIEPDPHLLNGNKSLFSCIKIQVSFVCQDTSPFLYVSIQFNSIQNICVRKY